MKNKFWILVIAILVVLALMGGYIKLYYYIPELSMTDIDFTPKEPVANMDTETFSAKIQNVGNDKAGSFDVCLIDNGKIVLSKTIDGLDKGKSVNVAFNYKFTDPGRHFVDLVVDCKGKIREENKENNKVRFELDVRETPSIITSTIFKKQLGGWYPTNYGGSSPVIYDGKLYVGGKNQYFFCFNKDTGEEIWSYKVTDAGLMPGIYTTPVFYKDNVYFGSTGSNLIESGGHIFALNAKDGSLVWKYDTDSDVFSLTLDQGEIFALVSDGSICRIDSLTGKLIKKHKIPEGALLTSSIVVDKGKIYVLGETTLFCVDVGTGNILWTFKGEEYMISKPIVYYGKVYLDGRYCLDAEKGFLIWENKKVERGSQVLDRDLFVITVNGELLCIDAINGHTNWERTVEPSVAQPVIDNQKIFIGTTTNKVYCLDEFTSNIIAIYGVDDVITTAPLVYVGKVYVVAEDGYLYCFKEA
jgi:outer membrane protein assembly factor BamB